MLVFKILVVQLLLAFALTHTCAFQLCLFALAQTAGHFASALHIQVKYIPGEGLCCPNWKQLAVFFLPTVISGVVNRHHSPVSCCPYACLEDTPLRC